VAVSGCDCEATGAPVGASAPARGAVAAPAPDAVPDVDGSSDDEEEESEGATVALIPEVATGNPAEPVGGAPTNYGEYPLGNPPAPGCIAWWCGPPMGMPEFQPIGGCC